MPSHDNGQWTAALIAAATALAVKGADLFFGWLKGRGDQRQTLTQASLTAETDERRDFIGAANDLRDRFERLQEKYAASLEERAILRGQNEALTLRVSALEVEAKGLREALETERRQSAQDRRQAEADRDSFRRELDELRRRVPLGDG